MGILDKWLQRIQRTMLDVYSKSNLQIIHKEISEEYILELQKEFRSSRFHLGSIQGYLSHCKKMSTYEMDKTRVTVLCNHVPKSLHKKVLLSLSRIQTICRLFHVQKKLDIVLLPIKEPRKKPKANQSVHPRHINGAYTYISDGTIYIYREEEWPKVILHEVLHNVPELQNIRWTHHDIERLYQGFLIDKTGCPYNCKTVLEPTEAVIEAWAIFLHTAFVSIEQEKEFGSLMEQEIAWNDQQSRWILEKQKAWDNQSWHEDTHAFSYIVLRGILLHNLTKMIGMKRPYSSMGLTDLFLKRWEYTKDHIMSLPYKKKNSLRMSRFGNI